MNKININLGITFSRFWAFIVTVLGFVLALRHKDSSVFLQSSAISGAIFGYNQYRRMKREQGQDKEQEKYENNGKDDN